MKRVRIIISGRVTGVFFRAFIEENANNLDIKGSVRNTEDGRVEAVFEGEEESINELIEMCKRGPNNAKVVDLTIEEEEYTGEFKDFKIDY